MSPGSPKQSHFKTHSARQPSDLRSLILDRSQVALHALLRSLPGRLHLLHTPPHTLPIAPVTLNYLNFLDSMPYLKTPPYLLPPRPFFPS